MSITNYFKTSSIKLDDVNPNNTIHRCVWKIITLLYEVSQDDKNLNKCYDINFSTKYKKFLDNSQNSEIYKTHAKNELLSFNQMAQINNYCSQLPKQLQITMNKSKQLVRLNKTLSSSTFFIFIERKQNTPIT